MCGVAIEPVKPAWHSIRSCRTQPPPQPAVPIDESTGGAASTTASLRPRRREASNAIRSAIRSANSSPDGLAAGPPAPEAGGGVDRRCPPPNWTHQPESVHQSAPISTDQHTTRHCGDGRQWWKRAKSAGSSRCRSHCTVARVTGAKARGHRALTTWIGYTIKYPISTGTEQITS